MCSSRTRRVRVTRSKIWTPPGPAPSTQRHGMKEAGSLAAGGGWRGRPVGGPAGRPSDHPTASPSHRMRIPTPRDPLPPLHSPRPDAAGASRAWPPHVFARGAPRSIGTPWAALRSRARAGGPCRVGIAASTPSCAGPWGALRGMREQHKRGERGSATPGCWTDAEARAISGQETEPETFDNTTL